jgi:hypothetical protein
MSCAVAKPGSQPDPERPLKDVPIKFWFDNPAFSVSATSCEPEKLAAERQNSSSKLSVQRRNSGSFDADRPLKNVPIKFWFDNPAFSISAPSVQNPMSRIDSRQRKTPSPDPERPLKNVPIKFWFDNPAFSISAASVCSATSANSSATNRPEEERESSAPCVKGMAKRIPSDTVDNHKRVPQPKVCTSPLVTKAGARLRIGAAVANMTKTDEEFFDAPESFTPTSPTRLRDAVQTSRMAREELSCSSDEDRDTSSFGKARSSRRKPRKDQIARLLMEECEAPCASPGGSDRGESSPRLKHSVFSSPVSSCVANANYFSARVTKPAPSPAGSAASYATCRSGTSSPMGQSPMGQRGTPRSMASPLSAVASPMSASRAKPSPGGKHKPLPSPGGMTRRSSLPRVRDVDPGPALSPLPSPDQDSLNCRYMPKAPPKHPARPAADHAGPTLPSSARARALVEAARARMGLA